MNVLESRLARVAFCFVASLPLWSGCSFGPAGPGTVPVSGKVTYDGKPVAAAIVQFKPNGGEKAEGAVGRTNAEGQFEMTTREFSGVMPGKYQVTVFKYESTKPANKQPAASENEEEAYTPPNDNARPAPGPKNLLPAKYAQPDKSGLTAEVTVGGANEFNLELVD